MKDSENLVVTMDHFRRALGDVSDLHHDDVIEIPGMPVATRLYLTAGVAIRFASKQARCGWQAWTLQSLVADGVTQDEVGRDFIQAELRLTSTRSGVVRIRYANNASHGDAYLNSEHLFGWSG